MSQRSLQILFALIIAVPVLLLGREHIGAPMPALAADGPPVLVELYTSQSCSSCPPADRFLAELAEEKQVVALGCHVTYWNHLQWNDPYSRDFCTRRQNLYRNHLGGDSVFTPEMIIDGDTSFVGSRRYSISKAIEDAAGRPHAAVTLSWTEDSKLAVRIGEMKMETGGPYGVWLARLLPPTQTDVPRGENRGRTLPVSQAVDTLEKIGSWNGTATELTATPAPAPPGGSYAVFIQTPGPGKVLGSSQIGPP